MRLNVHIIIVWAAVVSHSLAIPSIWPRDIPLPDGMPNPSEQQLKKIQLRAHGTLPNTPLPSKISKNGIINLQLIAFNELFEVAFFNELLLNITKNVPGYQIPNPKKRDFIIGALVAILAQEELHALTANQGLEHFKIEPIQPCRYHFPVSDFDAAIALAATFTDLVIATLQDVIVRFADNSDVDLTRVIAATIGNEGEQQGWFRVNQGKIPSELPTLTTGDVNFAFTAIQAFTIPRSYPKLDNITLTTFKPLDIIMPPEPKTQFIFVSWESEHEVKGDKLWLTYINQLNVPIVETLKVVSYKDGKKVVAKALFPYDENLLNGLTIAAVTNSAGPFAGVNDVAQATLFGPGLIIVN
ncbi:sexual development protein (LsdA) [Aspergillus nomiae NRRL 13137]|uniref:Sexual development protein (LsdA) n=1 Tax=Aspergillus nomiae NRRL (strain ATCC 15546 / NRRL 13137 / CBS 260.88 / M93) TaxID=1509407 RepID=A0A0L1J1T2_ASPN3|nr:sexual development protein (LsdA) [Aspergillus nomiae NRRL 13137]KNG85620.1 sexual development protein (LsdA) [Aspergillus nomiae NRRL 13137]